MKKMGKETRLVSGLRVDVAQRKVVGHRLLLPRQLSPTAGRDFTVQLASGHW